MDADDLDYNYDHDDCDDWGNFFKEFLFANNIKFSLELNVIHCLLSCAFLVNLVFLI